MIWRSSLAGYRNRIVNRCLRRNFQTYPTGCQQLSAKTVGVETNLPSVGNELYNFRVTDVVAIPDFNCRLIRLRHLGTGALYTHVDRNDSNNVFAIAFRTTPFDSTGLPHILEHISLMGSQKYPCRDPFFKMLNRSLATYLNACTAADFTVYPFATQNRNDYYNLMSVYLDAVFRPKLRGNDFRMEGWRLEHEDVNDPNSPIVFKGVVFNEMKGVFSENQNLFMESLLNNLLPSHTYGVCSGGDPMVIPQLTYEKLVDFHQRHYHPSNCRLYSYGNFDFLDHLKFVDQNYLKDYTHCESYAQRTIVPPETRWPQPRRQHIRCRVDPLAADPAKQSTIAVSYACADVCHVYESFVLKVVSQLLTDGPNASFYKTLIEPNIGSGYAPGTGYDSQTRDTTFTVGLQGVGEQDFETVEKLVEQTLEGCVRDGFDQANIENVLHGMELSIRHQGSDFGLQLMFGISSLWNHNGDVPVSLKMSDHMATLRKHLAEDPLYLQKVVEKYFVRNTHRLILTMSPDEKYEEQLQVSEKELLQQKLAQLDDAERKRLYEVGLELLRDQEQPQDVTCLPTLKIEDISERCDFPKLTAASCAEIPLQLCSVPTNQVTYFRSLLDVSELSDEQKSLLPLFVQIVSQMGTRTHDFVAFDQMVYGKTLGLNVGVHVADDVTDLNRFEESISMGSLCLDKNVAAMFDLWSMLFNDLQLTDVNRFSTLVHDIAASVTNGIASSGHHYATLYAGSLLSPANLRREQFGGLTFVRRMKEIASTKDLQPLLSDMQAIAKAILNKKRMRLALNLSSGQSDPAVDGLKNFVSAVGGQYEGPILKKDSHIAHTNELLPKFHFVLPFAVNYTSKVVPCVPYTHADFPVLRVLSKLLTAKYVLPLVRERYGAYGAGASVSTAGILQFYSYRDPNSVSSLNIFDEAGEWVRKNEFLATDVDEAKLAVFRDIDVPIAPSEQGMRLFLNGIDDEQFAQHRVDILKVNREHLLDIGGKYLGAEGAKVIIGADGKETDSWQKVFGD